MNHLRISRPSLAAALLAATVVAFAPDAPLHAQQTSGANRDLIAVLDLTVTGGTEVEGVAISNSLREELLKTGRYKLINRNQMEQVLEEQTLQQVTCSGSACLADVGKVLGVAFIVTGGVTKISADLFQVSASMIDVATAETVRAESVLHEGSLVSLLRGGIPSLAVKLAGAAAGASATAAALPAPGAAPAPAAPAGALRHVYVQKSSMPTKRVSASATAFDGKIFVIGGVDSLGLLEDKSEVYDPQTDTWADLKRIPTARANPVVAATSGGIFVFGGYSPLSGATFGNVDRFDPANGAWSALPAMPVPLSNAAGTALGSRIFIFGGEGEGLPVNSVHVYDSTAKTWSRTLEMPIAVSRHSAAQLGGLVYITGGISKDKELNTLFVFDPVLNTWTQKAPMKTPRAYHSSAVAGGRLYVFGGEVDRDQIDQVEEYDPATNSWTARPKLPLPLSRFSATTAGGKIYLIGGDDGSFGFAAVNLNYAYE